MKRLRRLVVAAAMIGGCPATEYVSHRRVDPTGRVSNLSEFLAWQASAEHFAAVDANGGRHVIAYGLYDSWLLSSSGPSAFVFDPAGRLVDWSSDIGDDPRFDGRWDAQRSRVTGLSLSRDRVNAIPATRPAG